MEPLRPLSGHAHLGIPGRPDNIMLATDHQGPKQDDHVRGPGLLGLTHARTEFPSNTQSDTHTHTGT